MNEKIDLSGVFSLAYIKKTRYTGSFHSMRYASGSEGWSDFRHHLIRARTALK